MAGKKPGTNTEVLTTGLVKTLETNTEVLTTGLVKTKGTNTEVLTTELVKTTSTNTEVLTTELVKTTGTKTEVLTTELVKTPGTNTEAEINMCVYCHMSKKSRVGRSVGNIFYFLIISKTEIVVPSSRNGFRYFIFEISGKMNYAVFLPSLLSISTKS